MILVTGGTGFIGRNLVRALVESGYQVRILLRPSKRSPKLPTGIPVEVAVSSLSDERGLRAAMKDVNTIFHLASAERAGAHGDLNAVDIQGTAGLVRGAQQAEIQQLIMVSHLGAGRQSAYSVLKAKGIAENLVQNGTVPYTILRTDAVFGPGDQFTVPINQLIRRLPFFFMPGDGTSRLQPIFVNDLVACLLLALENPKMTNRIIPVGGGEILSFTEIVKEIMEKTGKKRPILPITPGYLRTYALWIDQLNPRFPISIYWLDTLAEDRTCPTDSLPREFGILPARFSQHLDYLKERF